MNRIELFSLCTAILCLLFAVANDAEAGANKVPVIDACEINAVFCGSGGQSDLPDFISAFAIFNPAQGDPAMLTVMIKGSLPDETHFVFLCPGTITTGGFTGCRLTGTFMTNINGHGAFHKEFFDGAPTEKVVAINVPNFATVLANCPDEPNANCDPKPLQ